MNSVTGRAAARRQRSGGRGCRPCRRLALLALLSLGLAPSLRVQAGEQWTGRALMEEVQRRHDQYPYTFERQNLVLTDRAGHRDVHKLRRFSRAEADGTVRFLLVFDYPPEECGVALLGSRAGDGSHEHALYLPAFGPELKSSVGLDRHTPLLGTDFTVQDLLPEVIDDFVYQREADHGLDDIPHWVVAARPRTQAVARATGYSLRRHFIRQDSLFIVRTDYYDRRGQLVKRASYHDLKPVDGAMWRADMILMEDLRGGHTSLLKTEQRIFASDYVPAEMFTRDWLLANRHSDGATAPLTARGRLQPPEPMGTAATDSVP